MIARFQMGEVLVTPLTPRHVDFIKAFYNAKGGVFIGKYRLRKEHWLEFVAFMKTYYSNYVLSLTSALDDRPNYNINDALGCCGCKVTQKKD